LITSFCGKIIRVCSRWTSITVYVVIEEKKFKKQTHETHERHETHRVKLHIPLSYLILKKAMKKINKFRKTHERHETHETQPVNPSVGESGVSHFLLLAFLSLL
jgi:hypothetical protein